MTFSEFQPGFVPIGALLVSVRDLEYTRLVQGYILHAKNSTLLGNVLQAKLITSPDVSTHLWPN